MTSTGDVRVPRRGQIGRAVTRATVVAVAISRYTVAFDRTVGRWSYRVHRRLYRLTGGVIGHRTFMGPMLLLTTTGRRSGEARTTPLLYMPDGADYYVVGSNGGRDRPPAWLLNLEANPDASVQAGRRKVRVKAEVLRGDAKQAVWPRMVEHYSGWDHYQQLTEREIPAVRLRSVG
jgi:deazaflavin-dependent oxidoreductase (nitroreductase family)